MHIWKTTWKKNNQIALQIPQKWEDEGRNGSYEIPFMKLAWGTSGRDSGTSFKLWCIPSALNTKQWSIKYREKHKGEARLRNRTRKNRKETKGLPLKMSCKHRTKKPEDNLFWKRYSTHQLEKNTHSTWNLLYSLSGTLSLKLKNKTKQPQQRG